MASTAPAPDRLARADLVRFVAACYYEPDPLFAEERLFESLASVAERVDSEFAERARTLAQAFGAESLDALRLDYTRLFIGLSDVYTRPYASVWLSGEEGDVASAYSEAGFEIEADFQERPDHIGVELEFLYRLIHEGKEDARRRFVVGHLGRWVPAFAAAIQAGAQTAFYRQLAQLTERVVDMEARGSG